MFSMYRYSVVFVLLLSLGLVTVSAEPSSNAQRQPISQTPVAVNLLKVYKSPNCGCCKKWMQHLITGGLVTEAHHPDDLSVVKSQHKIPRQYQSCHTAVSKEGFVFEGHVPAKFIKQFLLTPPQKALGLSVPAMPVGSPGMEMGDQFMPYQVLLLKADGSSEIYADIKNKADQY